jgi:hypothetical protein
MGLKAMGVSDGPQLYEYGHGSQMGWMVRFRWQWGDGDLTDISIFKDKMLEDWMATNSKDAYLLTRFGVIFASLDDAVLCWMTHG